MNLAEIKIRVNRSIQKLHEEDYYLLEHDSHERSLAHRLGYHLNNFFPHKYNIDLEYNLNIDNDNFHKTLYMESNQLYEYGYTTRDRASREIEGDVFWERKVFPDIVIHKRGSNNNNLLVIELKKSTNTIAIDRRFDKFKLAYFTTPSIRNEFPYKYGLFIDLKCVTNITQDNHIKIYYHNGEITR